MYVTLLLLMLLPVPFQQADAEEAYRSDYAEYTEITQIADPAAQFERYLAFIDKGYDPRLEGAIVQGLQNGLSAMVEAKNYGKVYEFADKWVAARSGDLPPIALAWQAGAMAGNNQATVRYGEKLYAAQSIPAVAMSLANAYLALGNKAKIRQWGELVLNSEPIEETWSIAYALVGQHDSAGRFNQASQLAKKLQGGLGSAPQGVSAREWMQIRTYLQETVARASFEAGQWAAAIREFNVALRFNSRNDKAYYYIGESLLKSNEIADAMTAFAKSQLLSGGYSARSKGMLETIYKANHGGNLIGIDDIINQARRELQN